MSDVYVGFSNLPRSDARIETNLVPPNTDGSKVIITGVVLTLLTALWTYLRFWSIRQNGRAFLLEDGFNLGALVFFYGLVAADFVMVLSGGLGHRLSELQDWHVVRLLKAIYVRKFLYAASLSLIKISIILMFMRIFFTRRFKIASLTVIIFTVIWMLLAVLINLLICHPIDVNWTFPAGERSCGDLRAAFAAEGIIDIVNHIAILMLPLPMIWKLGMEIRYKVVTVCIFCIGLLTISFGTIHVYMIMHTDFTEISYTSVQTALYGTSEAGIAIIVSNCPLLRPVFDRLFPSHLSDTSVWREKSGEAMVTISRKRKSTKSSGFTQMKNVSHEDLELGNMGAHRARRNTHITAGKRPLTRDEDDDSSVHRIVVTSETIVRRDKGEL
ncbi:uncharacterized protein F4822DRAFT_420702 [Hypoxylon trugodes]|uniref:uncharacterized protein n=1 Tax=Hypoxylon trugodes TaxID=326681 RepID=UPI002190426F|nr:uncharacterized protein F4822DRAFT_420702 [Hypoxylon trugodes]KAI1383463.1 hypothetical protein F4822DRAFT_420702 [Hypoxylon trugodes]